MEYRESGHFEANGLFCALPNTTIFSLKCASADTGGGGRGSECAAGSADCGQGMQRGRGLGTQKEAERVWAHQLLTCAETWTATWAAQNAVHAAYQILEYFRGARPRMASRRTAYVSRAAPPPR